MLIFRYLAKEVFITLVSLTALLLLIFMSNQLIQYLTRAANGQIPVFFVMKLMMLELPNLMGLLLPLGFYMALLLAYGRLYADSEMVVLYACGYGPRQLLKHSLIMGGFVSLFVLVIMLWASPKIAVERAKLLRSTGVQMLVKMVVPQTFHNPNNGQNVFYVESIASDKQTAKNLFFARHKPTAKGDEWQVMWADDVAFQTDEQTSEAYLVFHSGKTTLGIPGDSAYQTASFDTLTTRLPHPKYTFKPEDLRTISTQKLWPLNNTDALKAAELQWRISIALMVLVLTLIAVPLSRVSPRSGKYAQILPAIGLFFVYANFMFVARNWVSSGKVPTWLGVWWLHLIMIGLGLFLLRRNRVKLA